jgi:hypothetical protein
MHSLTRLSASGKPIPDLDDPSAVISGFAVRDNAVGKGGTGDIAPCLPKLRGVGRRTSANQALCSAAPPVSRRSPLCSLVAIPGPVSRAAASSNPPVGRKLLMSNRKSSATGVRKIENRSRSCLPGMSGRAGELVRGNSSHVEGRPPAVILPFMTVTLARLGSLRAPANGARAQAPLVYPLIQLRGRLPWPYEDESSRSG